MVQMTCDETKTMKKTINVLLVEDNQADARLVIEYLEENEHDNFNVICADCLARALLIIKDKKLQLDVVILDLGLPDSTGLETFRRIWTEQDSILPIIILTGAKLPKPQLRSCLEGAQDFLFKGDIDSKVLVSTILNAIERSNAKKRIMFMSEVRNRNLNIKKEVVKLAAK